MKSKNPFLNTFLSTLSMGIIALPVQGAPANFFEGFNFDSSGNSILRPYNTTSPHVSNNLHLYTNYGGILMFSGKDPSTPHQSDGGITLWGNPVNIILESTGMEQNQASFVVAKGSDWGVSQPLFKIDALTGNSIFTGSNVSINGGSLSVGGSLSAGGSPVLTSSSAASVLTGQNFVQLGSGGVLNITSNAASSSNITGALTVAGGIGIAKDSYINGIRVGKGGGNVSRNTALGIGTLDANATGDDNTAVGHRALLMNTTGAGNSSFGVDSMVYNTSGVWNTAMGRNALYANTGNFNVGIGYGALYWNTSGSSNTAVGLSAGRRIANGTELTSVSHSVFIGTNSAAATNADTNSIVIGSGSTGAGSNTTVIGNNTTEKTYLKGETNTPSLRVAGNTVLEGGTVLEGQVTMAEAQGDISMGDYQ